MPELVTSPAFLFWGTVYVIVKWTVGIAVVRWGWRQWQARGNRATPP